MASAPGGRGYWLIAEDGGIFGYGAAPFYGSLGGCTGRDVSSITRTPAGDGYWIASREGRVSVFGSAKHFGWPFTADSPPVAIAVYA